MAYTRYRAIPAPCRIVLAAATLALGVNGPIGATMLTPDDEPRPGLIDEPSTLLEGWSHPAPLDRVVELVNQGQRRAAKDALARYLRQNPRDAAAWELSGLLLLEERRLNPARQALRQALSIDSTRTSAASKLAVVTLLQGDLAKAEQGFVQVLSRAPNDTLALPYLAWIHQQRGQIAQAVALYERLIHRTDWPAADDLTSVHVALANLYLATAAPERAKELLGPRLERLGYEAAPGAGLLHARALIALGEGKAAEQALNRVRETVGDTQPALRLVAAMLPAAQGRPRESLQALARVAEEHPELAPRAHYQRAEIAATSGALSVANEAAAATLDAASEPILPAAMRSVVELLRKHDAGDDLANLIAGQLERFPGNADVLATGVQVYRDLGAYDRAALAAEDLVALQPDAPRGHYLAAAVAEQRSRPDAAREHYRHIVETHSGERDAWIRLAALSAQKGDLEAAESILDRALEANPGDPQLLFEQATILDELGEWARASKNYRAVLERFPNHLPSLNNLATNTLIIEGDAGEARRAASRAYEIDGNDPRVQATYGWALLASREPQAALRVLEKGAKQHPDNPDVHYQLGRTYEALGQDDAAATAYAKANGGAGDQPDSQGDGHSHSHDHSHEH